MLPGVEAKRQQQLEAAERGAAERPDSEQAAELLDVLPLVDVDFERLEDGEFKALLDALNFEARYDPRREELAVRVVLVPELVGPNDAHARSPLPQVRPYRALGRNQTKGTTAVRGVRAYRGEVQPRDLTAICTLNTCAAARSS